MTTFPHTDRLLANNAEYARDRHDPETTSPPSLNIAVVACMDSRLDVYAVLGLDNGQVHMLRNAGGVITDDVIRSLCLSQRFLGTREIILIHHTECGLHNIDEDALRAELETEVGTAPTWAVQGFADPHDDVRLSIRRLRDDPFVPHTDHIRGFVFDVADGKLHEVLAD